MIRYGLLAAFATLVISRRKDREAYLRVPDGRIWNRKTGTGTGTPVILLHSRRRPHHDPGIIRRS